MKKSFVIAIATVSLVSLGLAACGGKKAANTTPGNTGGSAMEQKTDGDAGGKTYGGAPMGGGAPAPAPGASADPCAGGE